MEIAIKATTKTVSPAVLENTTGHRAVFSKDSSKEDYATVRESGKKEQAEAISTRGSGWPIKSKAMECSPGQMAVSTKATSSTTSSKATGKSATPMDPA